MQLMVMGDESPRMLRLCSQFLLDAAIVAEGEAKSGGPLMPAEPGPTVDTASEGTVIDPPAAVDPRAVFGIPPVNAASPAPLSPSEPNAAAGDAAPQLDRDGFPWDPRIHSATPTIKADGRWRQRRNLDNPTLVAVEAELRKAYPQPADKPAAAAVPAAPVIPPPPAPVSLPPPPPPPVVAGTDAPAATVIPPPPPPPPVAAVVQAGANAEPVSPFRALMKFVEGQTGESGKFSPAVMKPIHAQFGAVGWADYCVKCKDSLPALMDVIKGL